MSLSILSIYIYDDDISISIYIFIWLMPVVFFSEVACVRPKKRATKAGEGCGTGKRQGLS